MSEEEDREYEEQEQQHLQQESSENMISPDKDLRNRIIGASTAADGPSKSFMNTMMNKMSTAVLARAFLPSPKDIKGAMQFLDLGIKFQIMLYELSSSLFWLAVIEVAVFLFFQILFFASPKRMAAIYFHLLHLPRGAIGLILVKVMPNTHDLIKEIRIPSDAKIPFGKIADQATIAAQTFVEQFSSKCEKLLLVYAALTSATLILDIVSFLIEIHHFSNTVWKDAFADVSLLILAGTFIALDLYYFSWIFCTALKFPRQYTRHILVGLLGYFKGVKEVLNSKLSSVTGRNPQAQEPPAK